MRTNVMEMDRSTESGGSVRSRRRFVRSWQATARPFAFALALALLSGAGTVAAQGTLPTVNVSDVQRYEDETWMIFEVSLSAASPDTVTVYFETSDGTATSGTDFRATTGTLTFPPNSRGPQYLPVVLVYDDSDVEPDETFTLTLTNPKGATLGDSTATGTITNDDTGATLTASDIGETTATLTLSGHTHGWWYKGNVHRCTSVPAGTAADTISSLMAATPYRYTAYSDSTCVTALDEVEFRTLAPAGTTPTVSVSGVQQSEDETWMRFEVSLSAASRDSVRVKYATSPGTATSGTDFRAASGTMIFPANSKRPQSVSVLVYDDSDVEPDETFTLTLSMADTTGVATLGDSTATGTIKDDDARRALTATLTASEVTETTAKLTLGGHSGNWWYKGNAHECTAVSAGTNAVDLTGLTEAKGQEYEAYRDSTCATLLAAGVEFYTLGLRVISLKPTKARLTLFNYPSDRGNWWYKGDQSGVSCTGPISGDASITGLEAQTAYTYRAYAAAGCKTADELGSETFTTPATGKTTLLVSDIEQTTSTLTIAGHTGAWWAGLTARIIWNQNYTRLICMAVPSDTTTLALTGLLAGTLQSFSAYDAVGCDPIDEIARESWFTKPPTVDMSRGSRVAEGHAVAFEVSLSAPTDKEVTVDYETSEGTATAGEDYTAASGTLTFPAGGAAQAVAVRTLTDSAAEGDETFTLRLSNAEGATLGDAVATGTIQDDYSNRPATGAPTILGTARVGETLTASTADIEDPDGLSNAAFAYQWLSGDADISGATDTSYTLADPDEGLAIRVRVTFTDDAGNEETLTSAGTEVVGPRPNRPATIGAPTLAQASDTSVEVTWTAPDAKPAVTGYDVQYRLRGAADWTDHAHGGTGISATIGGLEAGRSWEARVRARNAAGAGAWSEPGAGHTGPARFDSAATEEKGHGLILTFTKDILIAGIHEDYTVRVDGDRRSTRHAFWGDNTVGLVLAEPVRWGETVTVAYAKPSSDAMLHDADELAIESFGPETVANTVPRPENSAATGAPTISGTPRVGEPLTASTADIEDADGLSGAVFAFQWLSDGADISGATEASYTLAASDEGTQVRVRVTFTDDAVSRRGADKRGHRPGRAPPPAADGRVPRRSRVARRQRVQLRASFQ